MSVAKAQGCDGQPLHVVASSCARIASDFSRLAAVGGAALAAATQNEPLGVLGVDTPAAFCGGFLMLFGSRMAGGCTSGHGLSGMGLLATASFVAVPAMFGGGIAVGFAMGAGDATKLVT